MVLALLDPVREEIDLDGVIDPSERLRYIGKAHKCARTGRWTCLADVCGALMRIEITITEQPEVKLS